MPVLSLPPKLQTGDADCGSSAFACVTQYWEGRGRTHKSDVIYGTHPFTLEPKFREAGYFTLAGEMDVATLKALTGNGWPVCCLVREGDDGHWVVVAGVSRGKVYYMDPLKGNTSEPVQVWEKRWTDCDRRGTVFRRYGLAVWWC